MNSAHKTARASGSAKATWGKASMLAIAGGGAFWVANFVISLTPGSPGVAVEIREARLRGAGR